MTSRIIFCAGLMALGAATSATAQPLYVAPAPYPAPPPYAVPAPDYAAALPPFAIRSIVRRAGFIPLSRPRRRGPRYVVFAVDRAGRQQRVVVNAHNGRILRVRPVNAAGRRDAYRPPAGLAAPPGRLDLPPGYVPLPRYAGRPPAAGALEAPPGLPPGPGGAGLPAPQVKRSAKTPMPRPRPSLAGNEAIKQAPRPAPHQAVTLAQPTHAPVQQPPAAAVKPSHTAAPSAATAEQPPHAAATSTTMTVQQQQPHALAPSTPTSSTAAGSTPTSTASIGAPVKQKPALKKPAKAASTEKPKLVPVAPLD